MSIELLVTTAHDRRGDPALGPHGHDVTAPVTAPFTALPGALMSLAPLAVRRTLNALEAEQREPRRSDSTPDGARAIPALACGRFGGVLSLRPASGAR